MKYEFSKKEFNNLINESWNNIIFCDGSADCTNHNDFEDFSIRFKAFLKEHEIN